MQPVPGHAEHGQLEPGDHGVLALRERGYLYEADGATWFKSSEFGDDKDRVVYRSNGEPTYFASDIGYLVEKFSRGFDELIYIWGADHHGTVARNRAAAEALGFDPAHVQWLLVAWVRFVRDGEESSMSKRAGEFVTLDELLDEKSASRVWERAGDALHAEGELARIRRVEERALAELRRSLA